MENFGNETYAPTPDTEQVKENVAAGIAGAFLFSLAGGIVYFILYLIGITASISGFIGVICAIKGYSIFAKRESKRGVLIAVVASLLVIVSHGISAFPSTSIRHIRSGMRQARLITPSPSANPSRAHIYSSRSPRSLHRISATSRSDLSSAHSVAADMSILSSMR